ncbi:MAG: cytochrome-c peroxidase [Sulfuricella sp.]|nr:cytochrome-c peroxidase [Sulfuricella sp.]
MSKLFKNCFKTCFKTLSSLDWRFVALLLTVLALLAALIAPLLAPVSPSSEAGTTATLASYDSTIRPLPLALKTNPALVRLGKQLYFEKRLSADDSLSCHDCHDLKRGGADGRIVGKGIRGALGDRNVPTVFNAPFNFLQFWDGRSRTLEDQAAMPIVEADEMGSSWPQVLEKLGRDPGYRERFNTLFSDGITPANITRALAEFERTLITPNAPFDRFLRGDEQALSVQARQGWQIFQTRGCVACHQGINIGGNLFQKIGVMARQDALSTDPGRFAVTGREEDRHVFKVPSLRNVGVTAPYFHNGSVATLEEAVRIMGRVQLGVTLDDTEITSLAAFLHSLTGQYREPSP